MCFFFFVCGCKKKKTCMRVGCMLLRCVCGGVICECVVLNVVCVQIKK